MMRAIFWWILVPALLPVVLVMWYVYHKDKYEREPLALVLKVIFFGALFSFVCIPAERIMQGVIAGHYGYATSLVQYELAQNVLGVGLVEELVKFLVLILFVWRTDDFNFRYDGIVYAVASALGFAGMENIMYVISYGTGVSVGRALFAIPGHAAFGVFMGFFLSRAKHWQLAQNGPLQASCMVLAVAVPTVVHGLYDFLLSTTAQRAGYGNYFMALVIAMDALAWLIIRHEFRTDRPLGQ